MKYEFKNHTDKGIVREVNEDNMGHMLNTPNGDIFVVCDGMGGHVGGQIASTISVESIISNLSQKQQTNIHVGISNTLIFANEQVIKRTAIEPNLKGMGSTATVAVIKDELLYVGHVGDSRAYIISNGKLYRITRDDSYVQMLVDNNTITEDEAETHPQKNRILKALGSQSALEPNSPSRPFKMKVGDLLLLCSDGLCSMVFDEAIEQLIDPNDLQNSINQMHSMAMNNGGKDNITIILLKVTESPHLSSDFDHFTTKYQNKVAKDIQPIQEPVTTSKHKTQPYRKKFLLAIAVAATLITGFTYYQIFNGETIVKSPTVEGTKDITTDKFESDTTGKAEKSKLKSTIQTNENTEKNKKTDETKDKTDNVTTAKGNKNPKYKEWQKKFEEACKKIKILTDQKNKEKEKNERDDELLQDIERKLVEARKERDNSCEKWKLNGKGDQIDDPKECECDGK